MNKMIITCVNFFNPRYTLLMYNFSTKKKKKKKKTEQEQIYIYIYIFQYKNPS